MNRGFSYYLSKSKSLVALARSKQHGISKLLLTVYSIASFIGKLFLLTAPIFAVADNNLAKMIAETHDFSLEKAFDGVGSKYKNLFVTLATLRFAYFAMYLILVLPIFISYGPMYSGGLIHTIGIIVLMLVALIVPLVALSRYAAVGNVSANSVNLDVGDILHSARVGSGTSVKTNVGLYFVMYFVPILVTVIYFAGCLFLTGIINNNGLGLAIIAVPVIAATYILVVFKCLAPMTVVYSTAISLLHSDTCKPEKSIVVKQVASSDIEYEVLFAEDVEQNYLDPCNGNFTKTKEDK